MKIHVVAALTALLGSHSAQAAPWSYGHAYSCLKALSTGIAAPGAPVVFNRTGTGVFPGPRNGTDGFYILTEKSAYFFPKEEMTRSGDSSSNQTKIAVIVESAQPNLFKIFYNPAGATPQERTSFGGANEFDRQIEPVEAMDESIRVPLNTAMGHTLVKARPLVETNRQGLGPVLDLCEKTYLDFTVDMGNGSESSFRTELKKMQDKLRPGFFSMEYWFPKKNSTN